MLVLMCMPPSLPAPPWATGTRGNPCLTLNNQRPHLRQGPGPGLRWKAVARATRQLLVVVPGQGPGQEQGQGRGQGQSQQSRACHLWQQTASTASSPSLRLSREALRRSSCRCRCWCDRLQLRPPGGALRLPARCPPAAAPAWKWRLGYPRGLLQGLPRGSLQGLLQASRGQRRDSRPAPAAQAAGVGVCTRPPPRLRWRPPPPTLRVILWC